MADQSRAAAKAEEVLKKMQTTFTTTNLHSSSAEVDNILSQIQKEATRNTSSKHMQVIGLEEEVRLKEVTIHGLYSKISSLNQMYADLEKAKAAEIEKVQEENKKMQEENKAALVKMQDENDQLQQQLAALKEKNTKVMQTAKEHQKGWKECVAKTEKKAAEKEKENLLLRSKMTKLMRTLEATVEEFSDLSGAEAASVPFANPSESEDCDATADCDATEVTAEEKTTATAPKDERDDCEQTTQVEKGIVEFGDIAERMSTLGCSMSCPSANE